MVCGLWALEVHEPWVWVGLVWFGAAGVLGVRGVLGVPRVLKVLGY